MRRTRNHSLVSDLAFLSFIVLCNICLIFTAGDPSQYLSDLILMNLCFFLAIVTYFTNVTAGLVLNVVFIFAYGIYITIQTVSLSQTIGLSTYFWMIMAPVLTIVVWLFTSSARELQEENELLKRQQERLVTVDETTDLKNSLSFNKDTAVFAGLSTRYQIPLSLLVIKVKYWSEIRRFIPEEQLTEAIYNVSQISQSSIRTNDALYLLDKEDVTWGLLLFTDLEGTQIVVERIKQRLREFNEQQFAGKYKVELNLRIGAAEYHPDTVRSPLEFIARAKNQLEYDV
ncbi:diguanylate cyclase domain-containing protein [Paenibacillus physcomitrellae]|uniref:GGDEF domain-containing protein n=1 Tax=Paenibacillus physcomitrellae TaxID=1619311 RepID=A0ABQ1FYU2_9BACL|nr:diguanylate cyclase [Paenibacillus physcomitrellae]GGA33249.1 GGDEF domain-containing protein [Paenibacillus physcomitrellae]